MSGRVFVDTNVLVYARDASEPVKQPRAADWLESLWRTRAGRLSTQVLQEYYVTVTRKLKPGLPAEDARGDIRQLGAWRPQVIDPALLEHAWSIETRYRLSFWDSAIVAAASEQRCDMLLSEDLQDGQDIAGVTVVNPFAHSPTEYSLHT